MKNIFLLAMLLFASSLAQATVQSKEVTYTAGGTTLKGYIAYDDAIKGKRPGVLVVHNGGVTTNMHASEQLCWRS